MKEWLHLTKTHVFGIHVGPIIPKVTTCLCCCHIAEISLQQIHQSIHCKYQSIHNYHICPWDNEMSERSRAQITSLVCQAISRGRIYPLAEMLPAEACFRQVYLKCDRKFWGNVQTKINAIIWRHGQMDNVNTNAVFLLSQHCSIFHCCW